MGCPERDRRSAVENGTIDFPGTHNRNTPWKLYNHLIGNLPDDILVKDYCLGTNWSYLEAECGMGVSYTCKGGARRTRRQDLRGLPLKTVAELAKSWCFEEASLGVAALNAYYARKELLDPLGAVYDGQGRSADAASGSRGGTGAQNAFELYRPRIERSARKNVTVVGHFPHVERIGEYANLTILERNCSQDADTPDPACEYVLPETDFAFITGVAIINKTAPRLLDLAKDAAVVLVGPSVVMSPLLFEWGVEMLAGSVVDDPEKVRFIVKSGGGKIFDGALQMTSLARVNP